ncbi:MAG: CRISPR-associated helicase Cas3' [Salinisphaera sp.]|jgi:CRISPR-associated endonuclease/helicase Cas3|nr:CRISPR-associated helicase Cas3' [Salinisphaera sp.]
MGPGVGIASYYRYWAKTRRGDARGAACHLLPFHNLDVAAVGWKLLAPERPLAPEMARRLDLPLDCLRRLLVFALGLHDIGKFARAFQGLARPDGGALVPPLPRATYGQRHDRLGALLWANGWIDWVRDGSLGWGGAGIEPRQRGQLKQSLDTLMAPIFGHHGIPVSGEGIPLESFFGSDDSADDCESARLFITDWAQVIGVDWPAEHLVDPEWQRCLQRLSWTIAGWAVASDWLGSDREVFEFHAAAMPLDRYWADVALPAAECVLQRAGFRQPVRPVAYAGLSAWFDDPAVEPTPLQRRAETQELVAGPQLFILEDVTGAGKTEAALILAQRLLAAGQAEGLYFALPTMATSNAMYARLGDIHRRFYAAEDNPSFVLAHGARDLNPAYAGTIGESACEPNGHGQNEPSAAAHCSQWLADSRKKALLADVGVGTIDQALMGLLPFRHQSLRLYGLARKVLIVDEVHAYDLYMQGLLAQLLAHHARQGGSAIVLTATLPQSKRRVLVNAWREGLSALPTELHEEAFPLLTHVSVGTCSETPVAPRRSVARSVAVEWCHAESQALARVKTALVAGQCVVWVRNTVDDAIRAFDQVRSEHDDPERCLLFHSRFVMQDRQLIESEVIARFGKHSTAADRRGQVLIATQVFQESLDCDADVMISDIAPIDLLIQRAGRLQRHQRGERSEPTLHVLAPIWQDDPDIDWLARLLPGTQAVYEDAALCWLTQKVLREQGVIRMPEDARLLIESVYGQVSDDVPDAFIERRYAHLGKQKRGAAQAVFNGLELADGYCHDANRPWGEDQEIGTRLSDEPSVNVVLLREGDDGALALWADEGAHAAMLSQLKVRESQARKLGDWPPRLDTALEQLGQSEKSLAYCRPWLPQRDTDNRYDEAYGLLFKGVETTASST